MKGKLNEKIMKMNFGRIVKKIAMVVVLFAIISIVVNAVIWQPRLSEIETLREDYKQSLKLPENDLQQRDDNIESDKNEEVERYTDLKDEKENKKENKKENIGDNKNERKNEKNELKLNKKVFIEQIWENVTPFSLEEKILLGSVATIWCLMFIIYKLIIIAWLYQASNRANTDRKFWVIVGLLFDLAGVVVFLIWRKCFRKYCNVCGVWQRKGEFCPECGSSLQKYCTFCNAKVGDDDKYCKVCGKSIDDTLERK